MLKEIPVTGRRCQPPMHAPHDAQLGGAAGRFGVLG